VKPRLSIFLLFFPGLIISEIFVDVRTQEEFKEEPILNTYNIEWQNILNIKEIASQDDEIYVFCRSGNRSEKAKKILEEAGYKQVYNIGGIVDASVFIQDIRYNSEN
tara:strand:- start:774 stop:1094 length:321 start_codon:yes stop_codon:yes gene_type:complete